MKNFILYDNNFIIKNVIDIPENLNVPLKELFPDYKYFINLFDEFSFSIGENLFNEINKNILIQFEKTNELKTDIEKLDQRLKSIENLLIHELLFSDTFGKGDTNVHFQQ